MSKAIKAVVFDFGNVVINIDVDRTYRAFSNLTFKTEAKIKQIFEENSIFKNYELGKFSDDEFREVIRQVCGYPLNDHEIDTAWNALILDIPKARMDYLFELRKKYPIYLLSNTNSLHIQYCNEYARKTFGISNLIQFFEKSYLSYELGLYKPDYGIYQHVLDDLSIKPEEMIFLDDREDNIQTASEMGIHAIQIHPPGDFMPILDIFLN
ncbi:MAG: HAD family hydrolase [Leadbetterella sp.]